MIDMFVVTVTTIVVVGSVVLYIYFFLIPYYQGEIYSIPTKAIGSCYIAV